MRVLLDESLPRQLSRTIEGHEARTVADQRWIGFKNGALLRQAADAGFDVFVTADQSIDSQQNLGRYGIGVVILKPLRNRLPDLLPLVPALLETLSSIRCGDVLEILPDGRVERHLKNG